MSVAPSNCLRDEILTLLAVFNPAVTLGMVMTKTIDYIRGLLLVSAQLTGAILASFLVQVQFPYTYNVRTTLSPSTSVVQGVFIEIILTAQLVFTVFMARVPPKSAAQEIYLTVFFSWPRKSTRRLTWHLSALGSRCLLLSWWASSSLAAV